MGGVPREHRTDSLSDVATNEMWRGIGAEAVLRR